MMAKKKFIKGSSAKGAAPEAEKPKSEGPADKKGPSASKMRKKMYGDQYG